MFVVGVGIRRMLGVVVRSGRVGRGVSPVKSYFVEYGRILGIERRVDGGFHLRTR